MKEKINDRARLELMLQAISFIQEFMTDIDSFETFTTNKIKLHAICYNVQCLGENCYKLSDAFIENHPATDWGSIAKMRHILVHDYYNVTPDIVWYAITEELQPLKEYITKIIQNEP